MLNEFDNVEDIINCLVDEFRDILFEYDNTLYFIDHIFNKRGMAAQRSISVVTYVDGFYTPIEETRCNYSDEYEMFEKHKINGVSLGEVMLASRIDSIY